MRYVTIFGYLYHITERQYREGLESAARGEGFHVPADRLVGKMAGNFTDLEPEEAQEKLDAERGTS